MQKPVNQKRRKWKLLMIINNKFFSLSFYIYPKLPKIFVEMNIIAQF